MIPDLNLAVRSRVIRHTQDLRTRVLVRHLEVETRSGDDPDHGHHHVTANSEMREEAEAYLDLYRDLYLGLCLGLCLDPLHHHVAAHRDGRSQPHLLDEGADSPAIQYLHRQGRRGEVAAIRHRLHEDGEDLLVVRGRHLGSDQRAVIHRL